MVRLDPVVGEICGIFFASTAMRSFSATSRAPPWEALGSTTEGSHSYTTGETSTATKLPLSLRETPQSVIVNTRQQMTDRGLGSIAQGMNDLNDVVKYAPGITLRKFGGDRQQAIVVSIEGDKAPALKVGDVVVKVDPRYFRPAEVETLLGDPTKAKQKLGWVPEITVQEMCAEMVREDLKIAQRHALLKQHGHDLPVAVEN